MPKHDKALTSTQVAQLSARGLHAVGSVAGLYLQVSKWGSRSWILRAAVSGKRRDIGLGGFPEVSLAAARERAKETRMKIWQGADPVAERAERKAAAALAAQHTTPTFAWCAEQAYAKKRPELKNAKGAAQWASTLKMYADPIVGKLPVDQVTLQHVLKVLTQETTNEKTKAKGEFWKVATESASRVRGRIEKVLAWATVTGYRKGDNPARWKGNLDAVMTKPSKLKHKQHHAALPVADTHDFVIALRKRDGMAAKALEFTVLTAARSGEVRGAKWPEIDLDAAMWTVPGERMKAGKAHRVPLSARAVAVLRALPIHAGTEYVFPALRGGAQSDMSLAAVVKRMHAAEPTKYTDPHNGRVATVHGFRSTFKDWARTHATGYADEVSELALAHVNSDGTRAAYARDELLPQRARMMADWAKFIDTAPPTGNVVALRKGKQA